MNTPSTAAALLLAGALLPGAASAQLGTFGLNDMGASPSADTIVFNGQSHPKFIPMGPPLPGQIVSDDPAAGAFNAASTPPPNGMRWASPDCTRIPCRVEPDPESPLDPYEENEEREEATPAPRPRPKPDARKSVPPPSMEVLSEQPLNNGRTLVTTPNGQMVCGNGPCRPADQDPEYQRYKADLKAAKEANERMWGQNRNPPPAAPAAGPAADQPSPGFDVGLGMGGDLFAGLGGDASASADGTSTSASANGRKSEVIYKGEVNLEGGRGWESLNRGQERIQTLVNGQLPSITSERQDTVEGGRTSSVYQNSEP